VVVTGANGMFSSGYDIGDIPDDVFAVEAERLVAHPFTSALDALDATDLPTVAALPGHTIGGGLELALGCDLRVAAEGIMLGMPPAKLGLVYSHTGLRRFIQAVGAPRTRELFLLGRNVDAPTALAWGLVSRVAADGAVQDVALDLAAELAGNAPLSVRGNKRVLRALLAADQRLDTDVERELIALREACFASEDMREGVRAFAAKRPARWQGR
jgi:enoyl-CoA hydratase/carnithine racemase